jgi:hypothetical protein
MCLSLSFARATCTAFVLSFAALASTVGCGGSDTPLGGPYGGTTSPTPPDTENTSEPASSGGGGSSSGGSTRSGTDN